MALQLYRRHRKECKAGQSEDSKIMSPATSAVVSLLWRGSGERTREGQ